MRPLPCSACGLAALLFLLPATTLAAAPTLLPQISGTSSAQAGAQADRGPRVRRDTAYLVASGGVGDFTTLTEAVASVPAGALLVVLPGSYEGPTISAKGLRIKSRIPGAARITSTMTVEAIGARQEVYLGGLLFEEGFTVDGCAGEVNLTGCRAIDDDEWAIWPPGLNFYNFPDCGVGTSRHKIVNSDAVTLVECTLEGRDGYQGSCDGYPGEHGLVVENSRVAVYGGSLLGGRGGDGFWCHGTYAGSGGDGLSATGAGTRVYTSGVLRMG
ncbi:MAG: hypothetical protein AAGG01_18930, partial [Planctomycetota bacterium]